MTSHPWNSMAKKLNEYISLKLFKIGIVISDDLGWDAHVHHINSKASKRIYYIRELKRSGLTQSDLIRIYLALVRSVCEYACPVWSTDITKGQNNTLESIQQRAFRIILLKQPYLEACDELQIPTLKNRHDSLCKKLFQSMCDPSHKLHHMIPPKRNLRNRTYPEYETPKCKTERFKNSFMPWCLFNCQKSLVRY
jgi:hypothetical protein